MTDRHRLGKKRLYCRFCRAPFYSAYYLSLHESSCDKKPVDYKFENKAIAATVDTRTERY